MSERLSKEGMAGGERMKRDDWTGGAFLVLVGVVAVILIVLSLTSCALWQLGTPPGSNTPLRPCVGVYVSPDSAGVCQPGTRDDKGFCLFSDRIPADSAGVCAPQEQQ